MGKIQSNLFRINTISSESTTNSTDSELIPQICNVVYRILTIFFIAETKGSMGSMELRGVEKAKIECAEKLFNSISTSNVKYHKVTSYQDLLDEVKKLE